jgi:hypothetical protein
MPINAKTRLMQDESENFGGEELIRLALPYCPWGGFHTYSNPRPFLRNFE